MAGCTAGCVDWVSVGRAPMLSEGGLLGGGSCNLLGAWFFWGGVSSSDKDLRWVPPGSWDARSERICRGRCLNHRLGVGLLQLSSNLQGQFKSRAGSLCIYVELMSSPVSASVSEVLEEWAAEEGYGVVSVVCACGLFMDVDFLSLVLVVPCVFLWLWLFVLYFPKMKLYVVHGGIISVNLVGVLMQNAQPGRLFSVSYTVLVKALYVPGHCALNLCSTSFSDGDATFCLLVFCVFLSVVLLVVEFVAVVIVGSCVLLWPWLVLVYYTLMIHVGFGGVITWNLLEGWMHKVHPGRLFRVFYPVLLKAFDVPGQCALNLSSISDGDATVCLIVVCVSLSWVEMFALLELIPSRNLIRIHFELWIPLEADLAAAGFVKASWDGSYLYNRVVQDPSKTKVYALVVGRGFICCFVVSLYGCWFYFVSSGLCLPLGLFSWFVVVVVGSRLCIFC